MDIKIYIFFFLSVINIILFILMKKKDSAKLKYRLTILYFYLMFVVCGDMIQSIRSGELPQYLSLTIFVIIMVIANIIFIGKKE